MKTILLVTDGIFHPTWLGRMTLHRALKHLEGFSFVHISSLEQLPVDLSRYAALVLHFHHKTISSTALKQLDQFVQGGGGLLAIHGATASFKKSLTYHRVLGGRFIGHGPVENFEVRRKKENIFSDIDDFFVKDELYIHALEPEIEVHFTATCDGREIPVVWTCQHGKGRVCYSVPGHTTSTMQHPIYLRLLQQGLLWVTE